MGWVANATSRPLHLRERPCTQCLRGWVGPRAGLDRCGKISLPPGSDPRTVQPVASRYTDWAIPAYDVGTSGWSASLDSKEFSSIVGERATADMQGRHAKFLTPVSMHTTLDAPKPLCAKPDGYRIVRTGHCTDKDGRCRCVRWC
jgi:hypothetical protein